MSVQVAKIINLEEHRKARQLARDQDGVQSVGPLMPPMVAFAWFPMWFVPVLVPGNQRQFG